MCGLIGYSGKKEDFTADKIALLMLYNSLTRGKDASGYYTRENGVVKDAVEADKFIRSGKTKIEPAKLFIGHVRAKTIGVNTKENAHPFQEGSIVLAHNGTLTDWYNTAREAGIDPSTINVDSQLFAKALARHQNPYILSKFKGAASLLFTDASQEEDILYVYKNAERPLFRGKINGNMYISSLSEPLEFIGCTDIKPFKDNILYSIKDGVIIANARIKNDSERPVTTPSSTTNSRISTKAHLEGKWIQYTDTYNTSNMTYGEWYLVDKVIDEHWVMITNNKNVKAEYSLACFDSEYYMFGQVKYARMMIGIYEGYSKSKKDLLAKGDIVKLVKFNLKDQLATVQCLNTGQNIDVETIDFRALTKDELKANESYINLKEETLKKNITNGYNEEDEYKKGTDTLIGGETGSITNFELDEVGELADAVQSFEELAYNLSYCLGNKEVREYDDALRTVKKIYDKIHENIY